MLCMWICLVLDFELLKNCTTALQSMGDKTTARAMATACGVPVVPGTEHALSTPEEAHAFAEMAGYPIILKAAFGGGGRGMRVVRAGAKDGWFIL